MAKSNSEKIKNLLSQKPKTNWMCNGSHNSKLIFSNNKEKKSFYVNHHKNIIINPEGVNITPDLKKLIDIEIEIAKICHI